MAAGDAGVPAGASGLGVLGVTFTGAPDELPLVPLLGLVPPDDVPEPEEELEEAFEPTGRNIMGTPEEEESEEVLDEAEWEEDSPLDEAEREEDVLDEAEREEDELDDDAPEDELEEETAITIGRTTTPTPASPDEPPDPDPLPTSWGTTPELLNK